MTTLLTTTRTELDNRSDRYAGVTLVWVTGDGVDETIVCVRSKDDGTYFEIAAEPYIALDVVDHPFACRDFARPSRQAHRGVGVRREVMSAGLRPFVVFVGVALFLPDILLIALVVVVSVVIGKAMVALFDA